MLPAVVLVPAALGGFALLAVHADGRGRTAVAVVSMVGVFAMLGVAVFAVAARPALAEAAHEVATSQHPADARPSDDRIDVDVEVSDRTLWVTASRPADDGMISLWSAGEVCHRYEFDRTGDHYTSEPCLAAD